MLYLAAWESTGMERIITTYLMQHTNPKQKGVQHGGCGEGHSSFHIFPLATCLIFTVTTRLNFDG